MPPGYTAFFMWTASAILWWSGWRKETADNIPDTAVAVFLAGWPLTAWIDVPLGGRHQLNGAMLWTALAMAALALRMENEGRLTALSSGFLIGSMTVWLTFIPPFLPGTPEGVGSLAVAAIAGLLAFVLAKGAAGQMLAVSVAVLLPDWILAAWLHESVGGRHGSRLWMQNWWTAVLAARLLTVLAAGIRAKIAGAPWDKEGEES